MPTRKETTEYVLDQLDPLEDREWLQDLVQRTADILPAPKPKRPKATRAKK